MYNDEEKHTLVYIGFKVYCVYTSMKTGEKNTNRTSELLIIRLHAVVDYLSDMLGNN